MPEIEILARALIIKKGSVLLTRKKHRDYLFLPGGHVEWNEPARKALERELWEEMGLRLKAGRFLGGIEHAFGSGRHRTHEINLVFLVLGQRVPRPAPSRERKIEFIWIPITGLRKFNLQPSVLKGLIPLWQKNKVPAWAGTLEERTSLIITS